MIAPPRAETMAEPLSIRGLSRRFRGADGSTRGVIEVDLEVAAGSLLALVGPSGSGKSTLLRLIAGLDRPDRGTIRLGQRDLAGILPAERDLGIVFDDAALYDHLDAASNVALALDRLRLDAETRRVRVAEALSTAGAAPLAGRRAESLSSGERRRVALARAIARRPGLLLLDEPLGQLDRPARLELRDEVLRLQRACGATAIVVTHDHEDAIAIADAVAFICAGRMLQKGAAATLLRRPAHVEVARGFGPAPMNVLETDGGWIAFSAGSVEIGPEDAGAADDWRAVASIERHGPRLPGALATARLADGRRVRLDALRVVDAGAVGLRVPAEEIRRFGADGRALDAIGPSDRY